MTQHPMPLPLQVAGAPELGTITIDMAYEFPRLERLIRQRQHDGEALPRTIDRIMMNGYEMDQAMLIVAIVNQRRRDGVSWP